MQREHPFSLAGLLAAVVASVPLAFFIGIGGAVITAMAGTLAALATKAALLHMQQARYRATFGEQQVEGILDSSQLDSPRAEPPAPSRQVRLAPTVVSLVVTLGAAGIVVALTSGMGINLSLEEPTQPSAPRQSTTPTRTLEEPVATDQEQWQTDDPSFGQVTETYYGNNYDYGYDNPTEEQSVPSQTTSQPDVNTPTPEQEPTPEQVPTQTSEPVADQPSQEQAPTFTDAATTTEASTA